MTFRTRSSVSFPLSCASANPWHRQFPCWPEARVAGSTPPTYTPLHWSMSAGWPPAAGREAQGPPVQPGDWEGENTSCFWAGCASSACMLPAAGPGSALLLLWCSHFPGKVAGVLWYTVKHGVASTILNILHTQILRSALMTWCQFCLRLIDKVPSVFAVLPKQSITVGNNYSITNTKLKLFC